MLRTLTSCSLALTCILGMPLAAQTQVWSEAPKTQRWSEAPTPPAPPPPAPGGSWNHRPPPHPGAHPGAAGRTSQWSSPTYTPRRSDADVQRQVDAITHDAERGARAGRGGWNAGQGQGQVPQQAWRDHMDRSRAQDQWQREQDAYDRRQRSFNPR